VLLEITPAQLALAWLLAQGHDVVPIPGTKHPRRAAENAAAEHIALTATQLNSWKRSSRAEPGAANEKRSPHTTTPRNAEAPERREYFTCRCRAASAVVIMSRSL
jgi:diketogulonate reductase-like aldo/keto reductase